MGNFAGSKRGPLRSCRHPLRSPAIDIKGRQVISFMAAFYRQPAQALEPVAADHLSAV
jgi:hypothetical protein